MNPAYSLLGIQAILGLTGLYGGAGATARPLDSYTVYSGAVWTIIELFDDSLFLIFLNSDIMEIQGNRRADYLRH